MKLLLAALRRFWRTFTHVPKLRGGPLDGHPLAYFGDAVRSADPSAPNVPLSFSSWVACEDGVSYQATRMGVYSNTKGDGDLHYLGPCSGA